MLLAIFGGCVILAVVMYILAVCQYGDGEFWLLGIAFVAFAIICIIAFVICFGSVANEPVLDDKIAMYNEENAAIETQMDEMVKSYMAYEGATFEKTKVDGTNAMTMITMFPELKSDTLVQAQIEVYVRNNDKIKALKEEKISLKTTKWWLWFGK